MNYKLFLDDIREPDEVFGYTNIQLYLTGWKIVRNYDQFIKCILENGIPSAISFDHDLGHEHYKIQSNIEYNQFKEKTGFHCAKWVIEYCIDRKLELPETILIHSWNKSGAANIKSLFDTYNKVKYINPLDIPPTPFS